jgi:hypothetical protein
LKKNQFPIKTGLHGTGNKPTLGTEEATKYHIPPNPGVFSQEELLGRDEDKPFLLRPQDVERIYGTPVKTVYDMVYRANRGGEADPIVFLKDGNKVLIPRIPFEKRLLRQVNAQPTGIAQMSPRSSQNHLGPRARGRAIVFFHKRTTLNNTQSY